MAFKVGVFEELVLSLQPIVGVDSQIESVLTKCPYPYPPASIVILKLAIHRNIFFFAKRI